MQEDIRTSIEGIDIEKTSSPHLTKLLNSETTVTVTLAINRHIVQVGLIQTVLVSSEFIHMLADSNTAMNNSCVALAYFNVQSKFTVKKV